VRALRGFFNGAEIGPAIAFVLGLQFLLLPFLRSFGTSLIFELILSIAMALMCLWLMRVVLTENAKAGGVLPSIGGVFTIIAVTLVQAVNVISVALPYTETPFSAVEVNGISIEAGVVTISDDITLQMFSALQEFVEEGGQVSVVALNSLGGNVFAARGIARLVQEAEANTIATGACYSSCGLVFISGMRRELATDGELGFHGYAGPGPSEAGRISVSDVASEEARDKEYFAERGIAADFTARAFATPHSDIWIPTPSELMEAGVLKL